MFVFRGYLNEKRRGAPKDPPVSLHRNDEAFDPTHLRDGVQGTLLCKHNRTYAVGIIRYGECLKSLSVSAPVRTYLRKRPGTGPDDFESLQQRKNVEKASLSNRLSRCCAFHIKS